MANSASASAKNFPSMSQKILPRQNDDEERGKTRHWPPHYSSRARAGCADRACHPGSPGCSGRIISLPARSAYAFIRTRMHFYFPFFPVLGDRACSFSPCGEALHGLLGIGMTIRATIAGMRLKMQPAHRHRSPPDFIGESENGDAHDGAVQLEMPPQAWSAAALKERTEAASYAESSAARCACSKPWSRSTKGLRFALKRASGETLAYRSRLSSRSSSMSNRGPCGRQRLASRLRCLNDRRQVPMLSLVKTRVVILVACIAGVSAVAAAAYAAEGTPLGAWRRANDCFLAAFILTTAATPRPPICPAARGHASWTWDGSTLKITRRPSTWQFHRALTNDHVEADYVWQRSG